MEYNKNIVDILFELMTFIWKGIINDDRIIFGLDFSPIFGVVHSSLSVDKVGIPLDELLQKITLLLALDGGFNLSIVTGNICGVCWLSSYWLYTIFVLIISLSYCNFYTIFTFVKGKPSKSNKEIIARGILSPSQRNHLTSKWLITSESVSTNEIE